MNPVPDMYHSHQQQERLDSVVEEFTRRLRHGQHPAISEYAGRYPEMAVEIEEILTSVAMIEELKTQSNSAADSVKHEFKQILKLDKIGDYRIVRELGRGGMGIVFEAVHESLGRRVAIKVMPNRAFDDQKYLERFRREAQAAANLHHTNIVSVFGIGQTGEHYYYVMEYVDGKSLSEILSSINGHFYPRTEGRLNTETLQAEARRAAGANFYTRRLNGTTYSGVPSPTDPGMSAKDRYRWAARLGLQIADGLAYAHGLGTLHRDIKPSNLLVDKNETVWLTDFGLVKNISGQSITKTGDIIGTPQYMAPESFEGNYDERSETYCLGLTLYEMVTLHPAYENASTPELIRRITTSTPLPPRKVDRRIPRDLDRIIQKAISREPKYRYPNAADIRDDLRAFLDDRPINARPISFTENVWRLSKRNPVSATLAVATGVIICLSALTATILLSITNQALSESEQKKTSLEVEQRVALLQRKKAEETIDFTVDSFDEMFRRLVFKGQPLNQNVSLDGFFDLAGVATTINESDAEFLEQMLQFFRQFTEKNQSNLALSMLTAKSYRRVANIYHLNGDFPEAIKAYEQAISAYREIQFADGDDRVLTLELVRTIKERGRAFELEGLPTGRQQALREYHQAIDLLRSHRQAQEPELQIELVKSFILMGTSPLIYLPQLPTRFEELRRWAPANWFSANVTAGHGLVPLYRLERPTENLLALNEGLKIVQQLIETQGASDELEYLQAMVLTRLAPVQMTLQDFQACAESLKRSEQILQKLQEASSENPEYKFALAQNYAIARRPGYRNQIQSLNKSKKILIALAAKYDRNLDYQRFLAEVSFRIGLRELEKGNLEAAERNFEMANATYELIIPLTPRNRSVQAFGLACLLHWVDTQLERQKFQSAIHNLENAIQELRSPQNQSGANWPAIVFNRRNLWLHLALAIAHKEAGDLAAAIQTRHQAIDYLESLLSRNRSRVSVVRQ